MLWNWLFVVGLVDTIDTVFPLENNGRSCVYPLVLVQQLGDFAVPPQEAMFLQVYRRHPRAGWVFFCGIGCLEMESGVVEMELVVVEVELAVVEMELEYEKPKNSRCLRKRSPHPTQSSSSWTTRHYHRGEQKKNNKVQTREERPENHASLNHASLHSPHCSWR